MNNNDEQFGDAIMYWIVFLRILLGASLLGLTLSIVKAVLGYFGIANPL